MSENSKPQREILVLQSKDEMRHPYQKAFEPLCDEIHWINTLEELMLSSHSTKPSVAVIDLDCLDIPLELPLQMLRTQLKGTDLIGISSEDSSKLALQCIRSGFTDFMLKPASPEELAWSIRKCYQRQDLINRAEPQDPRSGFVRAVSQISSATNAALVRLYCLEFFSELVRAESAGWFKNESGQTPEIECSIPKNISEEKLRTQLSQMALPAELESPTILTEEKQHQLIVPCSSYPKNYVVLWGISRKPSTKALNSISMLMEHVEISLLNIQKFEELKQQTFIDDLTGLYNSRFLKFAVSNAIMKCKDPKESFSVLFIDVDHFKSINDKYGHVVGSEFLVAIGRTIRNAVRGMDPVFRYGGDEFVVILNNTNTEGASEIAERIRKNIERRIFLIKEERLRTTVSIGVATYPDHASEREALLKMADDAMYSVKKSSRNSVHLATLPAKVASEG